MTRHDPAAGIRETARILQTAAREHQARREAIRTALTTAPRADGVEYPPTGPHGTGHRYDGRCALCTGDLDAVTDAVLGVVHGWEQEEPTDSEVRDQLRAAVTALGKAETELRALRTVARGYCPACGRGDCAPTVADWEQQRQRADKAQARVVDYEQRLTWHTTCAACSRVLASSIRETDRADQAVAQLDQVRALREDLHRTTGARWIAKALDHILNPEPSAPDGTGLYDKIADMFSGPLPWPPPATPGCVIGCSLHQLRQRHEPHPWQPQPGMVLVQCPGYEPVPAATQATRTTTPKDTP